MLCYCIVRTVRSWLAQLVVVYTAGVITLSCYCTDQAVNQCASGVCESRSCLVGVKNTGNVVRTCAKADSLNLLKNECQVELEDWSEVCGCDSELCNTFTYLRHRMSETQLKQPSTEARQTAPIVADKGALADFFGDDKPVMLIDNVDDANNDGGLSHKLSLDKSGNYPPNSVIISRPDLKKDRMKTKEKPVRESHLLIVLVVVPLSVGATAVCVIVLNYYCKLC